MSVRMSQYLRLKSHRNPRGPRVNYSVLFDVSQKGYNWVPVLIGLAFIGVGLLGWKHPIWRGQLRIHPIITISIGFVLALGAFLFQYSNQQIYERLLLQNQAQIVEGRIENFQPMPYAGHSKETFTIQGIQFAYSDYELTPAFNTTLSHGGPLDEGLFVKIYYTNSREFAGRYAILRIETKS
jgi:hypothetical protein